MKFTILTPTYNGRSKLYKVYESLCAQTYSDFEWIIVLDGYDEQTDNIVNSFINENILNIKTFSIKRNHKKAAVNYGIKKATGELLLIADDDDPLPKNSLEIFNKNWNEIEDKHNYIGITGLCIDENECIVGEKFPSSPFDKTSLDCVLRYNIYGEKWGFQRLDIMRKYPFFEDAEGYIGESTVWFEIGKKYKTRYINEIVRIYINTENSIMTSKFSENKIRDNCQAYVYGYRHNACSLGKYNLLNLTYTFKCSTNYVRFLLHSIHFNKTKKWMFPKKLNYIVCTIFGCGGLLFYLRDRFEFLNQRFR